MSSYVPRHEGMYGNGGTAALVFDFGTGSK